MGFVGKGHDDVVICTALRAALSLESGNDFDELMTEILEVPDHTDIRTRITVYKKLTISDVVLMLRCCCSDAKQTISCY